jgi:hypothetical protein
MCNACGFYCCGSDEFDSCGCDHCPYVACHCYEDDDEDYEDGECGFYCEEVEPEPAPARRAQQSGAPSA